MEKGFLVSSLQRLSWQEAFPIRQRPPARHSKRTNETEQEKKNLENKLDQKQDELAGLKGQHTSLKGQLNNLNIQLTEVSSHLAELEQQTQTRKRK